MDSTGALNWQDIPETLLVVGGGYIGLEMGTVYAELGSKVTVVELTDGLLARRRPRLGQAAAQAARKSLRRDLSQTKVAALKDDRQTPSK